MEIEKVIERANQLLRLGIRTPGSTPITGCGRMESSRT